jgi:hypothetical protein
VATAPAGLDLLDGDHHLAPGLVAGPFDDRVLEAVTEDRALEAHWLDMPACPT